MLAHHRVNPTINFAGTFLFTWVERVTMRFKCLTQEYNAVPQPGLEPESIRLESSDGYGKQHFMSVTS